MNRHYERVPAQNVTPTGDEFCRKKKYTAVNKSGREVMHDSAFV